MFPEQTYLSQCPSCGASIDVTSLEPFAKINCPECRQSVRVRRKFDHFVILKQIGEGGMSRVFEAEDETLGRHVALKILNRTYSRDAQRMAQFQQEALITARVTHPNVIKLFSVGYDQGHFFIAMELVTGGTLEARIKRDGIVPEKDALRIGRQVAEGLRAAHRMGLMHRDVKPANILFTEDGTAKVVDFGLSIFADRKDESAEIWATPYYVSPEKVMENREDFRSDLFSLGATIYHALTGKPPHKANSNSIQELRLIKQHPVQLEDAGAPFAPRTVHVVDKLCALKPEERPETYDAAVDDLRLAEGLSDQAIISRMSVRRKLAFGIAAAAVLAFGVGWLIRSVTTKPAVTYGMEAMPQEQRGPNLAALFQAARQTLIRGGLKDVREAERQFEAILKKKDIPIPTENKTLYNAALCSIMGGNKARATELLGRMSYDATATVEAMKMFYQSFGEQLSAHINGKDKGETKLAFNPETEEVLAYLAYGMAEWRFGELDQAQKYLEIFVSNKQADGELPWLKDYRDMAQPYLDDARLLAPLQKPEKNLSVAEAEVLLASTERARSALKTEGRHAKMLDDRITRLRDKILSAKRADQLAVMREEARRRDREMEQLDNLFWLLPSKVEGYDYSGAIRLIKEMEFKVPEVRAAADTKLYLYNGASEFLKQLFTDLARDQRSFHVLRADNPPLDGKVMGATLTDLQISLGSRQPIPIPLRNIEASSLIEMARVYCEEVSDTPERFRREELIILFATVEKVNDAASPLVGPLMDENPEFRSRWLRVQQTKS